MPPSLRESRTRLYLGNLDAKRDWGFAPEYVECQWLMLQQDKPEDFVIGTGESHTVREFVERCLQLCRRRDRVERHRDRGKGDRAFLVLRGRTVSGLEAGHGPVEIDPRYFRPTEVDFLLADPSYAKKKLGWEPKITFSELVKIMVDADMEMISLNIARRKHEDPAG